MSVEVWKKFDESFDNYEISNKGNIRSLPGVTKHKDGKETFRKGRILKEQLNYKGYKAVRISQGAIKKTFKNHRLVALMFIDNPENKPQVNHKDGVKTNNDISNLEWVTNLENSKHCNALGLNPKVFKKGHVPHNKKNNE